MGHVDVISRAAKLYDEVVVAVLHNPAKAGTFGVDERIKLLGAALAAVPNVRIEAFARRLLVDAAARRVRRRSSRGCAATPTSPTSCPWPR